jgi:hypothetical protein
MKKEFHFNLDEKRIVWHRVKFSIEAETLEEAQSIAIKMVDEADEVDFYHSDFLFDTEEMMSVEENNGEPTMELLCQKTGSTIYNNVNIIEKL